MVRWSTCNFNSHAPCGARRHVIHQFNIIFLFQLTRPLRGATAQLWRGYIRCDISTHTPLAGRDRCVVPLVPVAVDFNSHAPCGARREGRMICAGHKKFQLTRPLRGATLAAALIAPPIFHFNSHAPCGARPNYIPWGIRQLDISTHTPLAGRDIKMKNMNWKAYDFNSHAPCGARPMRWLIWLASM